MTTLPHLIEYKGVPCTGLFGQLIAEHIVEDAEVIKKWKGSVLFKLPGDTKAICGVCIYQLLAKFEDTKGINRRKVIQWPKKKVQKHNDLIKIHRKLQIEQHDSHKKPGVSSAAPER